MQIYYVYEHWRMDTGVCFYVGMGKNRRAYVFKRHNEFYNNVVCLLARDGHELMVKLIATELTQDEAFALEVRQITYWRDQGIELTNRTDGGDGSTGLQWTVEGRANLKQALNQPSVKAKLRKAALGRRASEETRAKMREQRIGRRWSEEVKDKIRISALKVQGKSRKEYCQKPEGKRQMLAMACKAANDPVIRAKRSENTKKLWADPVYRKNVMDARKQATLH